MLQEHKESRPESDLERQDMDHRFVGYEVSVHNLRDQEPQQIRLRLLSFGRDHHHCLETMGEVDGEESSAKEEENQVVKKTCS